MSGLRDYLPILRDRARPRQFQSLFLFVTSHCNSLCRTCFYFDKLNSTDDLTFDQIRRISETAPPFQKLWISGGEPFMREELAEVIGLFAKNNGIKNVNLPTNGLLPDKIFAKVDRMLELAPDVSIDLNFSFDGLANTHDAIRGVPNNFKRSLETVREAERRYKGIKRLRRNIVTCITSENYDEIVSLGLHMLENINADGHYFEVVRGTTPDPSLKNLTRQGVEELHRRLMPIHRRYADQLFAHLPAVARRVAKIYYLGNLRLHFDLHEKCFESPTKWPMPCTAGETTIVIDHNGRFRSCEMREPVGDLASHNFDVKAALGSPEMQAEVRAIPKANCWCTHTCFIQDSSKFSKEVQLFQIPYAWFKQRGEKYSNTSLEELERFKALELA
jgi:MoaA/NifB/PqqE/SkfB family radical SAM enzyme